MFRKDFKLWCESSSNITITLGDLRQQLEKRAQDVLDYSLDKEEKLKNFNAQKFIDEVKITFKDYPQINLLIQSLESKNVHNILDQRKQLYEWVVEQERSFYKLPWNQRDRNREQQYRKFTHLASEIFDFVDTLIPHKKSPDALNQDYKQSIDTILIDSEKAMNKIKSHIEQCISNIEEWNNSPILIEAKPSEDEYGISFSVADSAVVHVGSGKYPPYFSYFVLEDRIEVDDILEDEDEFPDLNTRLDYYNLINEIKNPGLSKKSKPLTLYTARPKEDRNRYFDAATLPMGIFLSNSYNHVEGLSRELSKDTRDIWRVRIDSKYVMMTMDSGSIKYYQVIKPNAPIISISPVDLD